MVHYVLCILYVLCIFVERCEWFVRCMKGLQPFIQVSLYMPLLSCSVLCWCGECCSNCSIVFVVLYVICKFVPLNRLVIVRMVGLNYVKVVLIFMECDVVVLWVDLLLFC